MSIHKESTARAVKSKSNTARGTKDSKKSYKKDTKLHPNKKF